MRVRSSGPLPGLGPKRRSSLRASGRSSAQRPAPEPRSRGQLLRLLLRGTAQKLGVTELVAVASAVLLGQGGAATNQTFIDRRHHEGAGKSASRAGGEDLGTIRRQKPLRPGLLGIRVEQEGVRELFGTVVLRLRESAGEGASVQATFESEEAGKFADLDLFLLQIAHQRLGGEIRGNRVEAGCRQDDRPGAPGRVVMIADHLPDPADLSGQVGIVGAALRAGA